MSNDARRHGIDAMTRAILDAAGPAVIGFDEQARIDYANPAALSTFGYTEDEVLGRPIDILVPEEDAALHLGNLSAYFANPGARNRGGHELFRGIRKDGTTFPCDIGLTPAFTADGLWTIATIVDVTEQLAAAARLRELNRSYLTLARFNEAIVRAADAQSLYEETCRVAVEFGRFHGAWIGRLAPDGALEVVASAGNIDGPREGGPTTRALREGTAVYDEYRDDASTSIVDAAAIPLHCGGRAVSALTLCSDRPHLFDEGMRGLLEAVAHNFSFALEAFNSRDRLEEVAAQRTELLRRLVLAQEEERGRIAADVHDDSVQALAAVDLRLGLLRRRIHEAAPELEDGVARLQDSVSSVTTGLRHLLFDLEPVVPGVDLAKMLRDAADHTFAHVPMTWTVEVEGEGSLDLPDELATQAFRIGQEALINVRKHARATHVRVLITPDDEGVEVAVIDDGVGVPQTIEPRAGHRGLATMLDRATITGGWCRLESDGPGSTLRFWVPRRGSAVVTVS
ncbi:PAS domain S-box protein [Nocardioides sp. LS1]|uniref:PAS domain-containing sensor histidine kinase n=1 Tax=Nocardioides sp. LS1 TaxID=1027620 RepID=UPI000F620CD4|nr:PAS domain S-box protein [Nocardioides sp. LS1]GCD90026.1 histidine kinase [Nocardioides sp. LS1]